VDKKGVVVKIIAVNPLRLLGLFVLLFCVQGVGVAQVPGQPANSIVSGSNWYCVSGYEKVGNQCLSIFARSKSTPSSDSTSVKPSRSAAAAPACAENGSCYGDVSENTGRPKTIYVDGYYRRDGTYVRGHYRSAPR
jgi:hypothetical protein